MLIMFRADASVEIGSGHVMRCLTLADELRNRGATIHFVCRDLPGHMNDYIFGERGYPVKRVPRGSAAGGSGLPTHAHWLGATWEEDAREVTNFVSSLAARPDWLVVDSYALDWRWERAVRGFVERVMVLDDLADRRHDCDLLLDQNFTADGEKRYEGLLSDASRRLVGPRYALLRPEFAAARSKPRDRTGEIGKLLVFLGSFDPGNATAKVLDGIALAGLPDLTVDVVIGQGNPARAQIETQCRTIPNTTCRTVVTNMASLMADADLAIGSSGATTWERCCLGLPSITLCIAENQRRIAEDMAGAGYSIYLGDARLVTPDQIAASLRTLTASPHWVRFLSHSSADLADGVGAERVARRMLNGSIRLRRAVAEDCRAIYEWRNAPVNREFSMDPSPIQYEVHQSWFSNALTDPARILLIGDLLETPVGVLRFDLLQDAARVSVYLVPGQHGKGLGPSLLSAGCDWLKAQHPEVTHVTAEVMPRNKVSAGAFRRAGFDRNIDVYRLFLRHAN